MSLINEALKRAKRNQEANPPATPPLEFRPVEPGQSDGRRTSLLLVGLSLVIVAIIGLSSALVWYVSHGKGTTLRVEASANPQSSRETKPASVVVEPATNTPAIAENTAATNTNSDTVLSATAAASEALNPAPLKLQGIFFNPKSPSAIVNGRTVYLGERVGGFFVLAMSPSSVTFANATVTNVLSLSE